MKALLILALLATSLFAFDYPPQLDEARSKVYRTVDDTELKVWIFGESDVENPKPAILFFFGGGWNGGSPEQFAQQARHFAKRGMIGIVADYRVKKRHQVKPVECVKDAKACLAWVRKHSESLGIIPDKICASGGSAGGHLAASTGTLSGFGNDERPNALILFNPVSLLADLGDWKAQGFGVKHDLGVPHIEFSPPHHVGPHTPPTLIMHGEADTTVPIEASRAFEAALKQAKVPVKLTTYPEQPHGFFNKRKSKKAYRMTLKEADGFLVNLGWIEKKPE